MAITSLRPDLDQSVNALPLYITGTLPVARPGAAYEAELQIHNQVGPCTIVSVTGGPVPPGGGWFIRGDKLVLSWPAYSADAAPINNANFELGDLTDWTVSKRGELPSYPTFATADSARPYSGAFSALWRGNEGLGHARGVEAVWLNDARADVIPGRPITASAQIALDDTHTSQNRGLVRLVFFDEFGDELRSYDGSLIRGDSEAYRLSTVTAYAPNDAESVGVAVWTTANESPGSGVRFGAVQWDAPQVVGINVEATLCFTVTIRDSAARTADWSGCVSVDNQIAVVGYIDTITNYGEATNHVINLPPSSAGDLLLVMASFRAISGSFSIPQLAIPAGWTQVAAQITSNSPPRTRAYWIKKIADGSEGLTLNVSLMNPPNDMGTMGAVAYAIANASGQTDAAISMSAPGGDANPDPPAVAPGWAGEDALYLSSCFTNNTSFPTVWSLPDNQVAGWSTNGIVRAVASTQVASGVSFDPPPYTTAGSANWGAMTVAVRKA